MQLNSVQDDVRNLLDRMIAASGNNPAVEKLSYELETLTKAYLTPTIEDDFGICPSIAKLNLTASERRIVQILSAKFGRAVRKDALYEALYYDFGPDAPDPKIIDVFICKIRKQLKNSGYAIETDWGAGYRLIKADANYQYTTFRSRWRPKAAA